MNKMFSSLLVFLCFFSIILKAQSDFKITVTDPYWSNPAGSTVELKIGMMIKNIGNETGWCEDLNKVVLICKPEYKIDEIERIDYADITKTLKPGEFLSGFMKYRVPIDADSITIIISEEDGARKFITRSYNIVQSKLIDSRYDEAIKEAERLERTGDTYKALQQYKLALTLSSNTDPKVSEKIYDIYNTLGDKEYFDKKYEKALDYYKFSIPYVPENSKSKKQVAVIYEAIGDQKLNASSFTEAKTMFDSSLAYAQSEKVELKLKSIVDKQEKVKNNKIEALKKEKEEAEYNAMLDPRVGFSIGGKGGITSTGKGKIYLPVFNLELKIPVKLYMDKKSKFCIFFNNSLGYDFITPNNNNSDDFERFVNLDLNKYTLTTQPNFIGNITGYGGLGFSFVNKYFIPLISANYGVIYQMLNKSSILQNSTGKSLTNSTALGKGFFIEADFKFGKASNFMIGYTFSKSDINGDYDFNNYSLTSHYLNFSYINF
ncbi:hypothetical protein BH10BAC5_BH10BAC5_25520 [soil metagenome]